MKKYIKKIIGLFIVSAIILSPYIMIAFQEGFIKACLIFLEMVIIIILIILLIFGLWLILE